MFNFGALPPEINSIRLYTGPGPAPMLAASTAWHGLAAELSSSAASYQGQVTALAAGWHGVAGQRMAAAAAPHIQWLNLTAGQAEQAALQATAQVVAYETAFAATTPPPVIAANRSLQMSLVATNFLGQNTPSIMATEALYMEMWAQCAAAMYGYSAATMQATVLPETTPAKPNTNPGGTAAQDAAQAQAFAKTAADNTGSVLGKTPTTTSPLDGIQKGVNDFLANPLKPLTDMYGDYKPTDALLDGVEGPYRVIGMMNSGTSLLKSLGGSSSAVKALPATGLLGAAAPGLLNGAGQAGALGSGPIAANLASATRLGGLSVPSSWAGAAPAAAAAANPLATANLASSIGGGANAPGHMLGGVPLSGAAGAARGIGDGVLRVGPRAFVMPRPLSAG